MNEEYLKTLSEKEKCITLAEALGWKQHSVCVDEDDRDQEPYLVWQKPNGAYVRDCYFPNFLNNRKDLEDVEKSLTDVQWEIYTHHLLLEASSSFPVQSFCTACRVGCQASPIQRIDALLLTLL